MDNDKILSTLFFSYQRLSTIIDLKKFNLNKNQHRILFYIYTLDQVSIKKTLEVLSISKQAFNLLCRDLIARNLIEESKSKQDKRIKVLKLTNNGKELIKQINKEQFQMLDQIFRKNNNDWKNSLEEMANQFLSNKY